MARVLAIGNMYPPQSLSGGYEADWQYVMHGLTRRGHAVRVLTSDLRVPDATLAPDDVDVHRELRWYWRDHEFPPIGQIARLRLERHNRRVLRRHISAFRPDVAMWWAMGGMSLSLIEQVRRTGLPAMGWVGDDWMDYGPTVDPWSRAWSRRRTGSLVAAVTRVPTALDLGSAAEWHFVSRRTQDKALSMGWDLPRSDVTPSGIDPRLFPTSPARPWSWRLLYAGRIDPRKGIQTAIKSLTTLPRAHLRIVGGGDDRHGRALRDLAEATGVRDRVEWGLPRPRELMAEEYEWADAVVFPVEWQEPWGLVPLEAMAVGRPVVATGAGGSSEYLRDTENCLLFKRGDPRDLAGALQRLSSDAALRERLQEGGLETVSRYTADEYCSRLEETLLRLIEEGRRSAEMPGSGIET
jgi:glycogen synthase